MVDVGSWQQRHTYSTYLYLKYLRNWLSKACLTSSPSLEIQCVGRTLRMCSSCRLILKKWRNRYLCKICKFWYYTNYLHIMYMYFFLAYIYINKYKKNILIYTLKYSTRDGEILLMEEILHQLRLVVYPIYKVLYIPVGCLGFLQQDKNRYHLRTAQMSWSSCRGGHRVTKKKWGDRTVEKPWKRTVLVGSYCLWLFLYYCLRLSMFVSIVINCFLVWSQWAFASSQVICEILITEEF